MTNKRAALESDFRQFMSGNCHCPQCGGQPRHVFTDVTPPLAGISEAQRNAMLEGAPSWMPNEPKGESNA